MNGLDHWVYADDFSGRQAAYLIMGLDPASGETTDSHSAYHIIGRLMNAYDLAHAKYSVEINGTASRHVFDESPAVPPVMPNEACLVSTEMQGLLESNCCENEKVRFGRWLLSGESDFARQRFSRAELQRWIMENNLPTKYQFSDWKRKTEVTEKPLLTRERNTLLSIIAVLCSEAGYDHKTPAKSANLIQQAADKMGISIGETTIEEHLKRIPNALASRAK